MNTLPSDLRPVRVWDLPTRVFHWALALALVGLVITGKLGGNALVWHMRLGLCVLALLVFRLLWGVAGGHWSRFAQFSYSPAAAWRYFRSTPRASERFDVGHNPLGGYSVWAMLLVLTVQVSTGLLADDEIATTGPLNRFVATATGLAATAWHKGPGLAALLALVVLHVVAIVSYRVRGNDLVTPMLRGDKQLAGAVMPSADTLRTRVRALVALAVGAALAVAIARLGG